MISAKFKRSVILLPKDLLQFISELKKSALSDIALDSVVCVTAVHVF